MYLSSRKRCHAASPSVTCGVDQGRETSASVRSGAPLLPPSAATGLPPRSSAPVRTTRSQSNGERRSITSPGKSALTSCGITRSARSYHFSFPSRRATKISPPSQSRSMARPDALEALSGGL